MREGRRNHPVCQADVWPPDRPAAAPRTADQQSEMSEEAIYGLGGPWA